MQGFQANPQNFGGAGLVVVRGLKCFKNQELFRLFNSRANVQANGIPIIGGAAERGLSETRGQMLCFHNCSFADDYGTLQAVAQFAHISRP